MKTAAYTVYVDSEDSEEFEKVMKTLFPQAEVNFDDLMEV